MIRGDIVWLWDTPQHIYTGIVCKRKKHKHYCSVLVTTSKHLCVVDHPTNKMRKIGGLG